MNKSLVDDFEYIEIPSSNSSRSHMNFYPVKPDLNVFTLWAVYNYTSIPSTANHLTKRHPTKSTMIIQSLLLKIQSVCTQLPITKS